MRRPNRWAQYPLIAPAKWSVGFRKTIPLMRCLSNQFGCQRPFESDSHKTCGFSAPKSRVEKRMRIRDEPSGGSHQRVVKRGSQESRRFARVLGTAGSLRPTARTTWHGHFMADVDMTVALSPNPYSTAKDAGLLMSYLHSVSLAA
jgi:hypothetical protein